jgi:tetratricopeptide (TPR) repeat protein
MRNLISMAAVFLLLSSCAGSSLRGKEVRLQASFDESEERLRTPASAKPIPLHVQLKQDLGGVPATDEDAAVFHFSMGQAFSLDNEPQKAIESYRATLVHDPKSALVRARLAAELVKLGNFAEAKLLCLEAIELDGKYVDTFLLLAGIQVAAKEYDGALATYARALKVDSDNRDALLYYGVTLAEVGRLKEGVAQLERLVKLKDAADSGIDQAVAFYYLAKVYEQAGQGPNAEKALKSALQRRPGFPKAALSLADLYLGRNDEDAAYRTLEEAFRENHATEIAERLAEGYLQKNEFEKAVVYLETMSEEDPANENTKLRLALVYWQLKWLDKSRLVLTNLAERYPQSSEIAFYLGELEMERGNVSVALGHYQRIAPDYAKYEQMVNRVVFTYRNQKRFLDAENFLQAALAKRPDAVGFYPVLASLYEDQSKMEEAKLALERGRKSFPHDENILYYLGFLYDRLGEKEKGVATMEALLQVNPDNANALNFVGYMLTEKGGDLSRAAELLGRAHKLKPNDAFVMDSYGWLLYRQGKRREAMKQLEQAFAMKPEEGVIAEHLADIYVSLNLPQKALAVYERARHAGGDQEFLARVEQKIGNIQKSFAEAPRARAEEGSSRAPASVR